MYFSAEHLALANQALRETFRQCSITWQAIPHWDTGDPGQINVPNGSLSAPNFLTVGQNVESFQLTIAEVIAPTPDALLTGVMTATTALAKDVDNAVLPPLYATNAAVTTTTGAPALQNTLISSRVTVENAGYRAPSCLITNTVGLQDLNQLVSGNNICQPMLAAANINSLYRFDPLDSSATAGTNATKARMILIGRRRRIAQGAAPEASPGEEPVDIAVSLMPSLEVDGEIGGKIQLSARIRYATRTTDATGLVAIKE
jgi:hypothetical protein